MRIALITLSTAFVDDNSNKIKPDCNLFVRYLTREGGLSDIRGCSVLRFRIEFLPLCPLKKEAYIVQCANHVWHRK